MIQRLLTLAACVIAAACVTVPEIADLKSRSTSHSGRFTISYEKDGAPHREQGGFEWKIQNASQAAPDQAMQLALLSPLGTTLAVIAFDPQASSSQRASLTGPTQTEHATDLDTLMQRTLGWRLPLAALLPWLGKTEPNDSPADWVIAVPTRHDTGSPKLITASNAELKLSVRLVFEE
jgi:outer membrane lipoprotein LolB